MTATTETKLKKMQCLLIDMRRVAVAFSGGVDSTFVLKVAAEALGATNVLAVTGGSDSLAADEHESARRLASELGVEHVVIRTEEFDDPNYLSNPSNRCYYCKTALYTAMEPLVHERAIPWIVNGTNADDLADWRPGLKAADEHHVRAPAAEAGLTKAEIRSLSERLGLSTHDKPASPCLSSRIPYGDEITVEKLRMIEQAENILRRFGFPECRVRHHGTLARIEVPVDQIFRLADPKVREPVEAHLRQIGYRYVTLDLRGFRSGSLNEVIAFGQRQSVE